VLSLNFLGETEENHDKLHQNAPISIPKFEPSLHVTRSSNVNALDGAARFLPAEVAEISRMRILGQQMQFIVREISSHCN
jgi:hypothetical protein